MLGDQDKAILSAKNAAEQALSQLKRAQPKAIFIFDCMTRHKLLGARIGEEITVIQSVLGENTPLIGFYTYGGIALLGGEIGPKSHSEFHNETMTLTVLGE